MTIDEAIKHLKSLHEYWDCYYEKREAKALELGIEALKKWKVLREATSRRNREAKDTVLAGCEIICIGEQPTDLIACPLSDEEQEKCRSRRQYESGRQAGIKEVMKWIESHRLSGSLMHPLEYYQFELEQWQAKLKEWRI